jgi:phosphoglycerol transferase MdoB-like AlkP superfamily enzyme
MLESFRAQEIGALGGQIAVGRDASSTATNTGAASLTPYFDSLAKQGILFRNFYGNGFQTRDGIVASYCGLYPNTGEPVLGAFGRVKERCLPEVLRERGYSTAWIHGGDSEFDGQRGFLLRNGFDQIVARWDFPVGTPTAGWGVTDEALMDKALETMRTLPEPFFAGILSITNHHPFEPPAGFSTPTGEKPGGEYGRFLDTMAYTDRALGRLIEKARSEAFFRNTVFVIYADHSVPQPPARPIQSVQDDLIWRHRIPLLIVADWLKTAVAVDAAGSQVDLPSLGMDLLGSVPSLTAQTLDLPWLGHSPLVPRETPSALVVRPGNYLGVLEADGVALESRGIWQQTGIVVPAHRQWAGDITLAERWALEQNRIVPDLVSVQNTARR